MALDVSLAISTERIIDLRSTDKKDVLEEMVEALATSELVTDKDQLMDKVLERERMGSTGVGQGLGIPHVKIPSIKDFVFAVGRSQKGIDFKSQDTKPVHIVVMIGCNDSQSGEFLKVLAKLVMNLKDQEFRRQILFAGSKDEIRDLFHSALKDIS